MRFLIRQIQMVGEQLGMLSKSEIRARGLHLGVVSMSVGFKAVKCSHQGNGDR